MSESVPVFYEKQLLRAPRGMKPEGSSFEPVLMVVERCAYSGEWSVLTLDQPPLYSENEVIHDARGNHIATAFNRAWEALQERLGNAND